MKAKDVMTAQVEGVEAIVDMALRAGNHDVSIRGYPVANHVLRLGDESETGTPFADQYADDVVDWAVGTAKGLHQTSERVGGVNLYQSIAVPKDLKANRGLTEYGLLLQTRNYTRIAVERATYWDSGGQDWAGGNNVTGTRLP